MSPKEAVPETQTLPRLPAGPQELISAAVSASGARLLLHGKSTTAFAWSSSIPTSFALAVPAMLHPGLSKITCVWAIGSIFPTTDVLLSRSTPSWVNHVPVTVLTGTCKTPSRPFKHTCLLPGVTANVPSKF